MANALNANMLLARQMTRYENGCETGGHEGQRCHQRPPRESRQAAYAVATGASSRIARAHPDQESCDDEFGNGCVNL